MSIEQVDLHERALKNESEIPFSSCSISECSETFQPGRIEIRHIESNGIGYSCGYTTWALMYAPIHSASAASLIDLRAHLLNNGSFACNAGCGVRLLSPNWIYGMNTYYDYRNLKNQSYHQLGLGIELLGNRLDLRANGYLPVGRTTSRCFGLVFDSFQDHSIFTRRKQLFSMSGFDAEASLLFKAIPQLRLYSALGPYYFTGKGHHAPGGKGRLEVWYKDYISLDASLSYDSLFRWIGQGQIGFYFPIGKRPKKEPSNQNLDRENCSELFASKALQRIQRNEIIPASSRYKKQVAKDPSTDLPYYVLFVNNLSHSNGTFESPYPTLQQALDASSIGDIIYVYAGDGTPTGLTPIAHSFQLLDQQMLLGAGTVQSISTTLGPISIPAKGAMPTFFAPNTIPSLLTLGNGNNVSGFVFTADNTNFGKYIAFTGPIEDLLIQDNIFAVPLLLEAIKTSAPVSGNVQILRNIIYAPQPQYFSNIRNQVFIFCDASKPTSINFGGNSVTGFNDLGSTGVMLNCGGNTFCSIHDNTIENNTRGILCEISNAGGLSTISVHNNIFEGNAKIFAAYPNAFNLSAYGNGSCFIMNNQWRDNGDPSLPQTANLYVTTHSGSDLCLTVQNNEASGNASQYQFIADPGSNFFLAPFTGNTPNFYTPSGTIQPVPFCPCSE